MSVADKSLDTNANESNRNPRFFPRETRTQGIASNSSIDADDTMTRSMDQFRERETSSKEHARREGRLHDSKRGTSDEVCSNFDTCNISMTLFVIC